MARQIAGEGRDVSRALLEALALEAYRERKLTTEQIRQLLGFDTRYELDGFLKQHKVWLDYTSDDLERESELGDRLWQQRQRELSRETRQTERRSE